ncbi:hypothetical protein O181_026582 [Austropuccinia psidii MF-1]|uniref:Uncharacterized protein n=1 Tax=Austropuccinia psidii MF-1 TaxID=1389203 RepID=A0A9Q3H0W8_9BASI|nr:hypothetical protein [Austropuccinia psidii MF-1]
MSPVHLRNLGFQRNQPEDREGFFRTRRPGRGHLGHSGGWQDVEGNNNPSAIHFPIQQEPKTKVQPSVPLGRTWSKLPEDMSQRDRLQSPYDNHQILESHHAVQTPGGEGKQDKGESSHYPSYRRRTYPYSEYSDSFRLTRRRPNQLSSSFQEKTRIQGQKQDLFSPKAERVRPNDTETVGICERSKQEPEVVVNNCKISSPLNRNITPTKIEHNAVTPESNSNSDEQWFKMSQYAEQTQKKFAELEASHERMKKLTASMDRIVKTLQEGHAQLRKASKETNKRLNIVFEEQHQS